MKITSVIFDLDGTLTAPVLDFAQIRCEMGLGPDSGDILAAMTEMAPHQKKQAQAVLERHEQYAAEHSQLNPGAGELFIELRKRNLPIGLLTRNTRKNTLMIAQRHQLVFDAIVDRQDGPVKPDAYGVLRLCRRFNAPPAQTLVVGDFLHDLRSAHSAGAIAVLIRTHQHAQEFESEADHVIDSLIDLLPLIDKLERIQVKEFT